MRASPSNAAWSSLPLYLVWLVSSHYCSFCVREGQQGQHGDGKEGRLCPVQPPGCPEGKEAWRAAEQRKRVSGGKKKRETFSLLFFSSFLLAHSLLSSSFLLLSHVVRLAPQVRMSSQFGGEGVGSEGGDLNLTPSIPVSATFFIFFIIWQH